MPENGGGATPENPAVRRYRTIPVIAVVALSLVMVFLAARQITANARFSGLLQLSDAVDRGSNISPEAFDRYLPDTVAIVNEDICRQDILNAGKKVVMRDLDRRNPLIDPHWNEVVASAQRYIRHGLSCLPTDGDLWLRLAMLREVEAAPGDEIAALMQQSQMLDPASGPLIVTRMSLWSRLPETVLQAAGPSFSTDLATLCAKQPQSVPERFRPQCRPETPR